MATSATLGFAFAIAIGAAAATSIQAQTQAPAPPAASATPAYSTKSTVGTLLDNPATKAVLVKYIPDMVASPQIDQARSFPLEGLAQFAPQLTPDVLAKINTDLAPIPAQ